MMMVIRCTYNTDNIYLPARNTILCHRRKCVLVWRKVNDTDTVCRGSERALLFIVLYLYTYIVILCVFNPQQQRPGKTSITRNGFGEFIQIYMRYIILQCSRVDSNIISRNHQSDYSSKSLRSFFSLAISCAVIRKPD